MSKPVIEERIYIGNVDFSATEDELKDFFQGLQVESVEIPTKTFTRGKKTVTRRLGFGFVQFALKEDADKALEQSNGQTFKTRTLYLRKALPPATPEEKKERTEAFLAKKAAKRAQATEKKKKLKGKKEKAANDENEEKAEKSEADEAANGDAESKKQDKTKTPEGTPSADTVFITNLDYKANVKVLDAVFKDLEPMWIHVPTRRVPRHILKQIKANHKPVYNRGIAFVKFKDQETQKRAIEEYNGREVNGRLIIVEAAVDRPKSDEDEETSSGSDAAESGKAETEA
uniref:RRM domain-containing protein n=1 Tax=Candidozyma auris TaxID=498019 RepID=A0A0L0NWL9_CANAR